MQFLDPTFTTALESFDFGSVFSPDGRDHPMTATTPVNVVPSDPGMTPVQGPGSLPASPLPGVPGGEIISGLAAAGTSLTMSVRHLGARVVVGVIGIGLLLIVGWRLTEGQ